MAADESSEQSISSTSDSNDSPMYPKTFKPKTVKKKTKTNSKKRKLNQLQRDHNNINGNNNEPDRKKRKLNKSLKQENNALKKENNKLIKERDECENEANKWKSQYMSLYARLTQITNLKLDQINNDHNHMPMHQITTSVFTSATPPNNILKMEIDNINFDECTNHKNQSTELENNNIGSNNIKPNEINISRHLHNHPNDNNHNILKLEPEPIASNNNTNNVMGKYDLIRDRLFEMGYDRNEVLNKISLYYASNESPQSVFNQLIDTFTPDKLNNGRRLRSNRKRKKINNVRHIHNESSSDSANDSDYSTDYVAFEDSYYISVKCHICKLHFDDIYKYRNHLRQHYEKDANKTWGHCDLGCNHKSQQDLHFIRHISTHTNDKPYKCNVKSNGVKCKAVTGYKSNCKQHWQTHFKTNIQTQNKNKNKNKPNKNKNGNKNKRTIKRNKPSNYAAFEDSYYTSVNCHICKQHFDDFERYRADLQQHYDNDPNKTWGHCDLGCDYQSAVGVFFVRHIATHTRDFPYKCNVTIDGIKCNVARGYKPNIKQHWKTHWNATNTAKTKEVVYNKRKNKKENAKHINLRQGHYKPAEIMKSVHCGEHVAFEGSFHFSVHCHLCRVHFDNYDGYCSHMEQHYNNDTAKAWKQCDFGCVVDGKKALLATSSLFISHIAQHTKEKPYNCDVVINGIKCQSAFGERKNIRSHWKSHFNHNIHDINKKKRHINQKKKNVKSPSMSKRKTKNKNKSKSNDFEDSYYVSVHCHLCHKHFEDIYEYRDHIKQHYVKNPLKTWLKCDFGCKQDVLSSDCNAFIAHIAKHTKIYPWKCNKCGRDSGSKSNLKHHWNSYHNKIYKDNGNGNDDDSSSDSNSSSYSTSYSSSDSNSDSNDDSDSESESEGSDGENAEFEESYSVSVDCHICNKCFNNYQEYIAHIKQHYVNDPNKKWKECDFGCQVKHTKMAVISLSVSNFIKHIGMHTKQNAFQCNVVMENGVKCQHSVPTKVLLKEHWKTNHCKQGLKNDESYSGAESELESEKEREKRANEAFEKSHIVSADCHVCNEHFESFMEYRDHTKKHYVNDPDKEWRECDFGCISKQTGMPIVSKTANNFITHIGMHTKQKPFQCIAVIENGIKCNRALTSKRALKKHWKVNHFKQLKRKKQCKK